RQSGADDESVAVFGVVGKRNGHCPILACVLSSCPGERRGAMAIEVRAIPLRRAAGFLVHVLTASGAAAAVAALTAAIDRDFARCFAWLGLALIIDGVDGTFARAARVRET